MPGRMEFGCVKKMIKDISDEEIESGRVWILWNGRCRRILERDIPLAYYHWCKVEGCVNPVVLHPEESVYVK